MRMVERVSVRVSADGGIWARIPPSISSIFFPAGGEVRIGGRTVNTLPPGQRSIAMVFQNYALYPHMKVRGNLGFGLRLAGVPKPERDRAVEEVANVKAANDIVLAASGPTVSPFNEHPGVRSVFLDTLEEYAYGLLDAQAAAEQIIEGVNDTLAQYD